MHFLWGAFPTLQRACEVWGKRGQGMAQRQPSAGSQLATSTFGIMKETLLPYHRHVFRSRVDVISRWVFGIAAVTLLLTWVCFTRILLA